MNRWIVMDCEDCGGTGEVGDEIYQGEFQPPERERCTSCDGSGRWKEEADAALNDAYAEGRKDEREANADLLVALRRLMREYIFTRTMDGTRAADCETMECVASARAAIARFTGEPQ